MIFRQIEDIIRGTKTETRRLVKRGETLAYPNGVTTVYTAKGHIKWQVGRQYAVVPKRAEPQVYYRQLDDRLSIAHCDIFDSHEETYLDFAKKQAPDKWRECLQSVGFQPLSIEIVDIYKQRLQDMTTWDAFNEGVNTRYAYKKLWCSINGKHSWEDNPQVFVIQFKKVS